MNQHIKQLAEQAKKHANSYDDAGTPIWFQFYNEKFAELILQECINEIHGVDVGDLKGKSYYLDKVAEHIEKHFGVEQ